MEPKFNTSFIPKKSLQQDVSGTTPGRFVNRRTTHGPGYYGTLLLLVVAIIASGVVFAYTKVVETDATSKLADIDRLRAAFKEEDIAALERMDARLRYGKQLVHDHVAVSELLDLLETLTLKKVRYTQLAYTARAIDTNNNVRTNSKMPSAGSMTLTGVTNDLPSVALQTDQYRSSDSLTEPAVTTITLGQADARNTDIGPDQLAFIVQMNVDPSLVSYSEALLQGRFTAGTVAPVSVPVAAPANDSSTSTPPSTG